MLELKKTDTTIAVYSEYNTEWIANARNLGGKWNGKAWEFALENEENVKEKLREVYGTDGETETETVTVNVSLDHYACDRRRELVLFGRSLVYRMYRDSAPKIGMHTIVLTGGFESSGGSKNNPRIESIEGTILQVRNVPLVLAKKEKEDCPEGIEIVTEAIVDKGTLQAEKAKLLARLAEIEALLSQ